MAGGSDDWQVWIDRHVPGSWEAVWKESLNFPDEGGENQNRDIVASARTYGQAVQLLEELLPLNDELARLAILPYAEFDARHPLRMILTAAKNLHPRCDPVPGPHLF